jgi:restriction system protein
MEEFKYQRVIDSGFVGRDSELEWLRNKFFLESHKTIAVTGSGGTGKTTLVKHFTASSRIVSTPFWLNLEREKNAEETLLKFIDELYEKRPRGGIFVVIDGADSLSEENIKLAQSRIYNIKATKGLIFIARSLPDLDRVSRLNLDSLSEDFASELIKGLLDNTLTPEQLELAIKSSHGNPLAMVLLAKILAGEESKEVLSVLGGQLYNFSDGFLLPEKEIITTIGPTIMSATDRLVDKLRMQPESIFDLSPREFEELLANLLSDMGWEVELTKATRDGGKDILAYLDTDLGKMLCLVEAKKYRKDRKIGVDLVRTLYGTLCDHQANSAMLITTSSFSPDAKAFQKRHEYQLRLRAFGDIALWIKNYKNRVGFI